MPMRMLSFLFIFCIITAVFVVDVVDCMLFFCGIYDKTYWHEMHRPTAACLNTWCFHKNG